MCSCFVDVPGMLMNKAGFIVCTEKKKSQNSRKEASPHFTTVNVKSIILDNCNMVVSAALAQVDLVIIWSNSGVRSESSKYSPLVLSNTVCVYHAETAKEGMMITSKEVKSIQVIDNRISTDLI